MAHDDDELRIHREPPPVPLDLPRHRDNLPGEGEEDGHERREASIRSAAERRRIERDGAAFSAALDEAEHKAED